MVLYHHFRVYLKPVLDVTECYYIIFFRLSHSNPKTNSVKYAETFSLQIMSTNKIRFWV